MNLQDARTHIVNYFEAAFVADFPATPLEYENRVQVDREAAAASEKAFLNVAIQFNDSDQISMGDKPLIRHTGMAVFSILTPAGAGVIEALTIASWLAQRFEMVSLPSGVQFHTVSVGTAKADGGFWLTPIVVPFMFDRIA